MDQNRFTFNMNQTGRKMDRGYLTSLAKESLEKDGIKAISPIVPFLDQEMITQFVREKYL